MSTPTPTVTAPRRSKPWASFVIWALLIAVAALFGPRLPSVMTKGAATIPGSDSDALVSLKAEQFPSIPPHQLALVLTSESLKVTDPAYKTAAESILNQVKAVPGVTAITDTWSSGQTALIGKDGKSTLVSISIDRPESELQAKIIPALKKATAQSPEGLKVYLTGEGAINYDLNESMKADIAKAERYVLPIILLVLIVIFGSVVASLLPLGLGVISVLVTMGLFYFYAQRFPVHESATSLISMLGMGVGVDYALFLVTRFREELAAGLSPADASRRTVATSGKAIIFSGATVVVSVASLFVVNSPLIRSLALAMVVVVIISILAAVTLLPGLLTLLGHRVNALRLPLPKSRTGSQEAFWHRWATTMMKKPILFTVLSLIPLLLISAPTLRMQTGWPFISLLPEAAEARQGFHVIEQQFAGGAMSPLEILVTVPEGTVADEANLARIYNVVESIKQDPAVDQVISHLSLKDEWKLADYKKIYLDEPKKLSDLPKQLGEGADGLAEAADGLTKVKSGLTAMQGGLKQIGDGTSEGARGAAALQSGLAQARTGLRQIAGGMDASTNGYRQLSQVFGLLEQQVNQAATALESMAPTSKADPKYAEAYRAVMTAKAVLNGQGAQGQSGPSLAVQTAQGAVGLEQLTAGLNQIIDKLGAAESALGQIAAGSTTSSQAQLQIATSLGEAASGLERISTGVAQASKEMKSAGAQAAGTDLTPVLSRGDLGLRLVGAAGGKQLQDLLPTLVNLDRGANVARLLVIPKEKSDAPATIELVRRLRESLPKQSPELKPLVGGTTGILIDMSDQLDWALPRVIGLVLIITFLVLLVLLRSVLLPLKAVILNGLSVSAAYGTLVWIFQDGHFAHLINLHPLGYLQSPIVVMLFAILFGLSMDYEVFLLSRVKEAYDVTGNNEESVAIGLSKTAGIITGAATIMVLIFGVFSTIGMITIKEMGIGLAVAVFLDASLIRIVLAPAFMRLAGDWNWWAPQWLLRLLPRLEIEH
ncbi:MAG TPA: MMPL family transporter [Symbiobacteriaceae bacterium]|nr:MMPL family transporter [Symbiobacteriaceae bacterium]